MTKNHRFETSQQLQPSVTGNILLVTNLSYFCQETHIFDVFDMYGHVQQIDLIRNDRTSELCSPCALVTMESVAEATEMTRILNNHLFMGRRLKISSFHGGIDFLGLITQISECNSVVEVKFSPQPTAKCSLNESFLCRAFVKFGGLVDVAIKKLHENYEGQARITFNSQEKTEAVLFELRTAMVFDGYTFSL